MSEIKRKDIAENDLFGDLKKSAKEANEEVVVLSETLKILVEKAKEVKGKVSTTSPKNLVELKKQNVLVKDAALLTKTWKDNQNALTKAQVKAKATTETYRKELASVKVEQQKLNKEAKLNAELTSKSVGAYRKAGIELARLKTAIKDATIAEGTNSKTVKRLQVDYEKLNSKVRGADKSVGEFGRNVGNYPSKLKGAIGSLKNFASSLGLVAGVAGLARAIKDTTKIYSDFEQGNANLAAILGATDEEVKSLTENSKRLGAITAFTATQVTELATEYGKLGFNPEEIIQVTEATLALAQATGTDLGQSAQQVGSTLRAYGLDANEAGRVTDIFAKAASASALDMEKLATALPIVGTTSKIAGVSLERTTALLGTLADRGLDASTSATSLRNVYLELSKQGLTWDDAMGQINNSLDKNATALALFGKRGATTAVILAENADSTKLLTQALEESGGTAQEMADKQLDTLQGAIKLLTSAWESLVLSFYEGNGALDGLKDVLVFVAKNLTTIAKVTGVVLKTFLAYKVGVFLTTTALKAYNFVQKLTTKGMKGLTLAAKANPLGVFLTVITVLIPLMFDFVKGLGQAKDETKELSLAQKILKDVSSETNDKLIQERAELKRVFDALKDTTIGTKERQDALDTVNSKYGTTLKNLENEAEFVKQLDSAYNDLILTLERKIKTDILNDKITTLIKDKLIQDDILKGFGESVESITNKLSNESLFGTASPFQGEFSLLESAYKEALRVKKAIDTLKAEFSDLDSDPNLDPNLDPNKTPPPPPRDKAKTEKELLDQRLKDLRNNNLEKLKILENNGLKEGRLRADIDEDLRLKRIENLKIENEFILKNYGEFSEEYLDVNLKLNTALIENNKKLKDINNILYKDLIDTNKEGLLLLETQLLKSGVKREEIDKQISAKKIENLKKELDLLIDLYGQGSKEVIKKENELQKALESTTKESAKQENNYYKERSAIIEGFTDKFLEAADARISKIDEEISAAQKQYDIYAQLAAEGNITAKESLAEQNAIIAEAEAEKARQEQIKQNIALISSVVLGYNAALQNGATPQEALKETFLGTASIKSFMSALSIPAFFDGTENTGTHGQGVDGKGGFNAILHPNERVMTSEHNNLIGDVSNDDVAKIMFDYRMGKMNVGSNIVVSQNDNSALESEMKNVTEAIKNIPQNNIEVGEITQGYMMINQTKTKGRTKTTNRFKVN